MTIYRGPLKVPILHDVWNIEIVVHAHTWNPPIEKEHNFLLFIVSIKKRDMQWANREA